MATQTTSNEVMTYSLFIWDADGDMGDGRVIGTFRKIESAEALAIRIREYAEAHPEHASVNVLIAHQALSTMPLEDLCKAVRHVRTRKPRAKAAA